jgi:hypothetical protein
MLIGAGCLLALILFSFFYISHPSTVDSMAIIVVGFVLILSLLLLFLNWYLEPKRDSTPRKDFVDIFMKFASSMLVIGSLILAWLSLDNTRQQTTRNLELARTTLENNIAEQRSRRFMEALEKLGGATPALRLAGVYAFKQLDSDFKAEQEFKSELDKATTEEERTKLAHQREQEKKEHWAIMEILTHHIQEASPVPKNSVKGRNPDDPQQTEIYEILKYLGSRKISFESGDRGQLNFISADLSGYRFKNSDDPEEGANFEGALFGDAYLKKADFEYAKLRKANFDKADLTEAILRSAKLNHADFRNANLSKADLQHADLTDANFSNAHLEGADLRAVTINNDKLFEFAFADEKTKCPESFKYDASRNSCVKE